ncbi:hypothetical protein K6119_17850 [Paracrocinitomix mangrovi]|uniref:tetratricopeptide repeat protein n=1 Tax=Paracrocinitomix mangrovi TaxID=2862509 RepID=UPI001C8D0A0F|nr:hypothetical protein [Paracrocinitomix mangrovi]UKN01590.1 hypothetical protein K6119_17850 [Paracrocinitomix mangrovi]
MRFLLLIVLTISSFTVVAQNKKDVREADRLFKKEQYAEAMPMYRKFIDIDPSNMDYVYKFGGCMLMVTDKTDEALKLLLKAEKMGKKDEEISYFIGRAYEKKEQFNDAIMYYEKFSDSATKEDLKALKIKKRIKDCQKAQKALDKAKKE